MNPSEINIRRILSGKIKVLNAEIEQLKELCIKSGSKCLALENENVMLKIILKH